MALFAIGDPHLSLDGSKPMTVFSGWDGHVERLTQNWERLVGESDTVVIAGDVSWGMTLEGARADLAYLHRLPGRKLLFKGNHDYWWTTRRKMDNFLDAEGFDTLRIVHNDAVVVDDEIAVCGSRGWFYDAEGAADRLVLLREAGRLRTSIQAAKESGCTPIVFLHYPPIYAGQICNEIVEVLQQEGIRQCYYGHVHSHGIRQAFNGELDGIRYQLISADAVGFCPVPIKTI